MSSRREEKEQRKQERLEQEAARARQEQRAQLLRRGGGALVALVALAVVAVVAIGASGGDGGDGGSKASKGGGGAPIPEQKLGNLDEAAKAAGCEVTKLPEEPSGHVEEKVTYKSNPPTSGAHDPVPAEDGVYTPGNEPQAEPTVHSLEHGRINVQYKSGLAPRRISQLETLAGENAGYHVLLFRNQTKMPYEVAATGWKQRIGCKRFTDAAFDALRAFRAKYVDKAPEFVP